MANLGFTENTIHKLMELVDSHKDKDIDDMTYIELSNSIKFLFDKLKEYPKYNVILDVSGTTHDIRLQMRGGLDFQDTIG